MKTLTVENLFGLIFLLMLVTGIVNAAINNNYARDIVRDVLPFFYMLIPFALHKKFYGNRFIADLLLISLVVIGAIFTYRILINWGMPSIFNIGKTQLLSVEYLGQSPLLLFNAIFCSIYGFYLTSIRKISGVFLVVLGFSSSLVFFGQTLRGPAILFVMSFMFFPLIFKRHISKKRYYMFLFLLSLSLFALVLFSSEFIYPIIGALLEKHALVGQSGKLDEYGHMLDFISTSGFNSLIFGQGFGGLWISTLEPWKAVSYTHSLFNYNLLKFGISGVFLFFIYVGIVLVKGFLVYKKSNSLKESLIAYSIILVFLVNILLEPGFKVLELSLLLSILFILKDSKIKQ